MVGYVYDGDTVELECGGRDQTARLVGFDTPETKDPGCEAERALGEKAKKRLREIIANSDVSYRRLGHDKYGRKLIRLTADGVDVGDTLIGEELAVAYTGGSRINWCVKLGAQ
nr:thermonuclease family protein [Lentibacter algarum]